MTYFADLSTYTYYLAAPPVSKNVGWLDEHHEFPTREPSAQLVNAVWDHCKVLVAPTRGIHECPFCMVETTTFFRHETWLMLGTGEIRVFDANGSAFAAPNMIYHYILEHQYRPPEEFLQAIESGVVPGSQRYTELLGRLEIPWRENIPRDGIPKVVRLARTDNGVETPAGGARAEKEIVPAWERDRLDSTRGVGICHFVGHWGHCVLWG